MKGSLVVAVFALALLPGAARADTPPSHWDRAREPAIGDAWELHRQVSELIDMSFGPPTTAERTLHLDQALTLLLSKDADKSKDPNLLFDLGTVYERLEHSGEAKRVLEAALALAPDYPGAERAWNALATAYAKTDDSRAEIAVYDRLLVTASDPGERSRLLSNRAEAEMRLGNLDLAIDGYRESIEVSRAGGAGMGTADDEVLAHWGLAVALDRARDPRGAAHEVELAMTQHGLGMLLQPFVFFVPSYERFYYLALGQVQLARGTESAAEGAQAWLRAEDLWAGYVGGATRALDACKKLTEKCEADRWLELAKGHLAEARRERAAAERRSGRRAVRPHEGETFIE